MLSLLPAWLARPFYALLAAACCLWDDEEVAE